jgi:hypothetical protein
MIYNEQRKELQTNLKNEYIFDMYDNDKLNLFQRVSLANTDTIEHYNSIIIDDMEKYIREHTKEE